MKNIYQDIVKSERAHHLAQMADEVIDNFYYAIPLTADELAEMQSKYAENAVKLDEIQKRMKEAVEGFKNEMKPFELQQKEMIRPLKTKVMERNGVVYKIVDEADAMARFYNEDGVLVAERRMMEAERQTTIFRINKNA